MPLPNFHNLMSSPPSGTGFSEDEVLESTIRRLLQDHRQSSQQRTEDLRQLLLESLGERPPDRPLPGRLLGILGDALIAGGGGTARPGQRLDDIRRREQTRFDTRRQQIDQNFALQQLQAGFGFDEKEFQAALDDAKRQHTKSDRYGAFLLSLAEKGNLDLTDENIEVISHSLPDDVDTRSLITSVRRQQDMRALKGIETQIAEAGGSRDTLDPHRPQDAKILNLFDERDQAEAQGDLGEAERLSKDILGAVKRRSEIEDREARKELAAIGAARINDTRIREAIRDYRRAGGDITGRVVGGQEVRPGTDLRSPISVDKDGNLVVDEIELNAQIADLQAVDPEIQDANLADFNQTIENIRKDPEAFFSRFRNEQEALDAFDALIFDRFGLRGTWARQALEQRDKVLVLAQDFYGSQRDADAPTPTRRTTPAPTRQPSARSQRDANRARTIRESQRFGGSK